MLHRLRKRGPRKFERAAEQGPAASIVHLDWSGADSPRIRLRRAAFTLANYELVLRDGERIQAELSPDLLVLDEVQRGIS